MIVAIRNMRAEMNVPQKQKTPVKIHAGAEERKLVEGNRGMLERLANVEGIEFEAASLAQTAGSRTTSKFEVVLVYQQKVDAGAERDRLQKELARLEAQLANAQRQLGNEQFLSKAPPKVVEGLRKQEAEVKAFIARIKAALDKLK